MHYIRVIFLIAASTLALSVSYGAVYRWVDEDGKVHYSDKPVENAEQVTVRAPESAGTNEERAERQAEQLKLYSTKRQQAAEKRQQEREARKQRAADCERARERAEKLTYTRRLYDVDESGNRVYVDEEEEQRRQEAQQEVSEYCD
ncbi:MAG: DUF4124 domain-containing protein [Gammaproteobacteria bacterium]|nr:DUF4124 domain-containing protein [Gammaproteobacteria bacterium]